MKKLLSALLACALLGPCAPAEETMNDEPFMTGILVDAAMHTLLIEWQDGETYAFHKEGDEDLSGLANGLYLGSVITVTYEGEIDWDARDTSGARLTAISDGDMYAELVSEEWIEGQAERTTLSYIESGLNFGAFIDLSAFSYETGANDFVVSPANALPGTQMTVEVFAGQGIGALAAQAKADMEAQKLALSTVLGELGGEEVQGLMGEGNGFAKEVYFIRLNDIAYRVTLSYALDAREGFGVRLRALMGRLEFTDSTGRVPMLAYGPDDDYNLLTAREAMTVPTPQGYVNALYELGALDAPATVLSAEISGDTLTLDMSRGFGSALASTGTAGEYMMMGSLVNTMIVNLGVEKVKVTSMGKTIETGHCVYDEPLSFYE